MKNNIFNIRPKVGILGGGQLGRMLFTPALDLDVSLHYLDPNPESPCLKFCKNQMVGDFNDKDTVLAFGKDMDIISVEIEHVNTEALYLLEQQGKLVFPQPRILDIVKDKGIQKQWYRDHDIPTADFYLVDDASQITDNFPMVQKLRTGGYDGKGVQVIADAADMPKVFHAPSVIETKVDFEIELAVLVARNQSGDVKSYPVVAMDFDDEANLVAYLYSPARIDDAIAAKARAIAEDIITKLDMVGLLAIEFFLTKDGRLIVNEMAPRPHNSGHHTIEGNITSQYEQHLRSILNLPLGNTAITHPSVMVNLLGAKDHQGKVVYEGIEKYLGKPSIHFHLYGKSITKPFRKMGHVTIVRPNLNEAIVIAQEIKKQITVTAINPPI